MIDLKQIESELDHLANGRYTSERDRRDLGVRLIDASPLLLEAFDVLVNAYDMGEIVTLERTDGTTASADLAQEIARHVEMLR